MKVVLVDAINGLMQKDGTVFQRMYDLLEAYPHRKIVLTGANDEQIKQYNLSELPYELFTLKHDPEKTDPAYYRTLLEKYNLSPEGTMYFEHKQEAVESARSVGIPTYYYDHTQQDLASLKTFLDNSLRSS